MSAGRPPVSPTTVIGTVSLLLAFSWLYVWSALHTAAVAECGNRTLDRGEACDDGNARSGDGCSAACLVEAGYACTGGPMSVCRLLCGNRVVDQSEGCDDGNTLDGDGCSAECRPEEGSN